MQNQRTKLMYSESRGFYYEADLRGIAEAEQNLRKAQLDKTVSELQKRITELQDQMKKETDEIDKQIKSLNDYAEKWSEVTEKLKEEIEDQRALEILGKDWLEEVLNESEDLLKQFTDEYIALQKAQKEAYLEARRAELENPPGGDGGNGGRNPSVPSPTEDDDDRYNLDEDKNLEQWEFNGKKYNSLTEAQAAKQAYVNGKGQTAYEKAYEEAYNKWKNKPVPESVKNKEADRAATDAKNKAIQEANKLQIKRIPAKFLGTDHAQPGETLVGELGSEIVLHKDGTASIVDSPTMMNMKGGEKVFNAEETEKILKSKYVPLKKFDPKKFAMLHSFASGTSSPMQSAIAAQAVGIANGLNKRMTFATGAGGQTINQTFNISLPNITDSSKASDLFREFESLQRKATQYFNK